MTTTTDRPAHTQGIQPDRAQRQPKAYPYRWLIRYTATAQTPLSIGDGRTASGRVTDREDPNSTHHHNTIARDDKKQPYLVASGLKGALRAWARVLQTSNNPGLDIASLFGAEKSEGPGAERRPGYVDVHDAHLSANPQAKPLTADQRKNLAHPGKDKDPSYIDVHTAIDRDTQTVADRLLFNQERVVPGAAFQGGFLIQHHDQRQGEKIAQQLLGLLNASSETGGLPLGGDTGRGMGRVKFSDTQVSHFGPEQFTTWLKAGAQGTWRDSANPIKLAAEVFNTQPNRELTLNIQFTGPFLVNDPSRVTPGQGENSLSQTPRLDPYGKPVLPATSLQGALRAQAERILCTLGIDPGGAGGQPFNPDSPGGQLIAELFGHTDRAAALEHAAPPLCTDPGAVHHQDFIAIDRFTGGGKDGAKYKAESRYRPAFQARLRQRASAPPLSAAAKGLLLLTLRDLAEGDIPLGWGKRKGYGACQASGPDGQSLIQAAARWLGSHGESAPTTGGWLQALRARRPTSAGHAANASLATLNLSANGAPSSGQKHPIGTGHREPRVDNRFHNSYHFVPLPQGAELPGWVECTIVQDKKRLGHHSHARYATPEHIAYSGRLTCTMRAETPFIVGGKREKNEDGSTTVHPYQLPDGQLAIPASSLKGLISNIAEAASGSAMRVLDETSAISYRMSAAPGEPYKQLGYLFKSAQDEWKITPMMEGTHYEYIPINELLSKAKGATVYALQLPSNGFKRQLVDKRCKEIVVKQLSSSASPASSLAVGSEAIVRFDALSRELTMEHLGPDYKKKAFDPQTEVQELQRAIAEAKPYHRVKIGINPKTNQLAYKKGWDVRNEYKEVAENRLQQLQLQLMPHDIVYFQAKGKTVIRLSHSQIWRDLVWNEKEKRPARYPDFLPSPELRPLGPGRSKLSPAELMFGFVEIEPQAEASGDQPKTAQNNQNRPQALAFAGKLRFADALPTQPVKAEAKPTALKLLANPKPPSPALYFKAKNKISSAQTDAHGYIAKRDLSPVKHQLNGRKTYLHALGVAHGQVQKLNAQGIPDDHGLPPWQARHASENADEHAKQRTWAHLLPAGSGWEFHVDFDNLSRDELSLLVYSLRPAPAFRHKLGLGKAIGLGSVDISPQRLDLIDRQQRYGEQHPCDPSHQRATGQLDDKELEALAADYRNSKQGDPAARAAQLLLGDPAHVRYPVHVPQVLGADIEKETFQWFVDNDRESKTPIPRQNLVALDTTGANGLPSLERLHKAKSKPPRQLL
jgi:CRISPR-associated protein (TIGR03986 family)